MFSQVHWTIESLLGVKGWTTGTTVCTTVCFDLLKLEYALNLQNFRLIYGLYWLIRAIGMGKYELLVFSIQVNACFKAELRISTDFLYSFSRINETRRNSFYSPAKLVLCLAISALYSC